MPELFPDPLWLRPSASTNLHNRERTAKFAAAYGTRRECETRQEALEAVGLSA